MSDVKTKQLPSGESIYTCGSAEDGTPNVSAFAEVLSRILANHPGEPYIEVTGFIKRGLAEQLVFILGKPKGQVS